MAKMTVLDREIRLRTQADADYISLTDISRYRDEDRSDDLIRNWLRNRNTLEFLGIWEQLYNPDFNSVEFDGFKSDAGLNSFTLTPKQWIEKTGAIGIVSKAGRYGGTYGPGATCGLSDNCLGHSRVPLAAASGTQFHNS